MKSQLLKSESRKGYYMFDYVIQPDRQPERHLVVRGHTWACVVFVLQQFEREWRSSIGPRPVVGRLRYHRVLCD